MNLKRFRDFSINLEDFILEQDRVFSGIKMSFETISIAKYKIPRGVKPNINKEEIMFKSNKLALPPRLSEGGIQSIYHQRMPDDVIREKPVKTIGIPSGRGKFEGAASLKPNEFGFDVDLDFEMSTGIKSNVLYLSNIPNDVEIIIPAARGISLENIPTGALYVFGYPSDFNDYYLTQQFIIFKWDDKGFWIYCDNYPVTRKRILVSNVDRVNGLSVSFICEAKLPYSNRFKSPTFHIESFSGGWKVPATRYKKTIEKKLNLKKFDKRDDFPNWAREISLFVEARGLNWGGYITHTFSDMKDRLDEISKLINPKNVLIYISGWNDWYDILNIEYEPSEELGGIKEFKELISYGHKLGFKFSLYVHHFGIGKYSPQWERFKNSPMLDNNGNPTNWAFDRDGDGIAEDGVRNVSLNNKEFRDYIISVIKKYCFEYKADSAFIDQLGYAWPEYSKESDGGAIPIIQKLKEELPKEFLITGEGVAEYLLNEIALFMGDTFGGCFPLENTGPVEPWRHPFNMRFHPVVKYIVNDYVRTYGHCASGEPGDDLFDYKDWLDRKIGNFPTIMLPHISKKIIEFPQFLKLIERAIDISNGKEELSFRK